MIRALMLGRTGNNLFQYAMGRVLAERHGVPLVLNASWFNFAGWSRVSCLRRLPLKAEVTRPFTLTARALLKLTGKHYWEYSRLPVIRETVEDQSFDPRYLEAPADCLLFGYFQSPLYFRGIEPLLREELRMDGLSWEADTLRIRDRIRFNNTVAVHIRRTDYVGNAPFEVCDLAYYRAAMSRLRERMEGARFFLFSDDPAWCAQHLAADDVEVCALPHGVQDPLHDLHLMSEASHHIIANSSYSWWAAWLGKKTGQQVLMPSVWYRTGMKAPAEEKRCDGWEFVDVG
ncbi:alpha-1,2-fucosyltransferase [Haloferula sp. BvORR071]|uniref:alpha-1,2-fucosyltransferase n=1 Tax=Haloferula sp. BvORR071 TaxID=1396141 RepID=UPI0005561349|nr:alpha-1,2-fucosyltransferase [Haloferula sp. BvORR071]